MGFTKVCLVGATGQLGKYVLRRLQESTTPRFEISVLTRAGGSDSVDDFLPESPDVEVTKVDYNNHQELVRALHGVEVIVSALPSVPAIQIDEQLLEAGKEAGVRRIFPSEYTLDVLHPAAVEYMGDSHPRIVHARKFMSLQDETTISATTLVSGMFLDLAMQGFHGNIDVSNRRAMLVDGGNVAALKMPEEETKNKRIHIAEVKYTGRQIVEALEGATKEKFTITSVPNAVMKAKYKAAQEQGLVRETFVLPVGILNFSAADEQGNGCGAGLLEDGLSWNAGGFLDYKRKTLLEIAQGALR